MTRRASDGALFVAEVRPGVTGPANIHQIQLAGSTATLVATHAVGTVSGVLSCAALPDGTVLVGAENMSGGPMAGRKLGILDPATSSVTPLLATLTGEVEAVAIDRTGTLAYVVVSQGTAGPGALHEVALPAGTTAVQRATFANRPRSVAVDNAGRVLVATHHLNGGVFVWDPVTPTTPPAPLPFLPPGGQFAIGIERATGNFVVSHATNGATTLSVGFSTPAGPLNVLTAGPAAGWGTVRALVPLDDPEPYGSQSTCVSVGSYEWLTAPNPGGLPLVGNATFSITVQSPSPQPACVVGLSFAPAAALLFLPCAQLLLDPASLAGQLVVATGPGTEFTLPLGIPNVPGLAGVTLFAQSFRLVGTPILVESSPGLRLTVL